MGDMHDSRFELVPGDAQWPELVPSEAHIASRIYGMGDAEALSSPCISIIGARRGSPYGIAVAQLAARIAAECGITVVSGGAIGCDCAAARAAIKAGGRTIVVAGCGADRVYPRMNADIYEAARANGAVVSLTPWGGSARAWSFPRRNKLIAALSRVLVVCEASMPSGTFSTAQTAIELDRVVYAAPGSIFSRYSKGTNWLLEQGASIFVDDESLEMAIAMDYGKIRRAHARGEREVGEVMEALMAQPMRADHLATTLGRDLVTMLRTLGDYEAKGLVTRLPDGCYAPTERAFLDRVEAG